MVDFDRNRARLTLTSEDLRALVRLATNTDDPTTAGRRWTDAAVVVDGVVDPVAAAMALVAVEPHRAIALERFDGATSASLYVGWDPAGRVTITEAADGDHLAITATHRELLPALLLQALRIHPDLPSPDRVPLVVPARLVDAALAGRSSEGGDRSVPDELRAVMDAFSHGWRATGSWRGRAADDTMTVVDTGTLGLWMVTATDDEQVIHLGPVTVAEAVARLGDVVSGRTRARAAA